MGIERKPVNDCDAVLSRKGLGESLGAAFGDPEFTDAIRELREEFSQAANAILSQRYGKIFRRYLTLGGPTSIKKERKRQRLQENLQRLGRVLEIQK